jgi:hypothetical protein
MARILWDDSGLAKRYTAEAGRATVNAIFVIFPLPSMTITAWGYAETYSILLRKRNAGILDAAAFSTSLNVLRTEVILAADFEILEINSALIFSSLSLMHVHNITSADAAILATYLRFQRATSEKCLLVASDKRLNRATEAEGLKSLNPEEVAVGDIPGWIS